MDGVEFDRDAQLLRVHDTLQTFSLSLRESLLLAQLLGYATVRNDEGHMTDAELDKCAYQELMRLITLGLIHIDLGIWPLVKAALMSGRSGLSLARGLTATKTYPNPGWISALIGSIRASWTAFNCLSVPLSLCLVLFSLQLDLGCWEVLAGVTAPIALVGAIGIHEFSHLMAVRITLRNDRVGSYIYGPLRLAVARPRLKGTQLRLVAAAGPIGGFFASLLMVPVPSVWFVSLGILGSCYHLANLSPSASDGKDLWSGSD